VGTSPEYLELLKQYRALEERIAELKDFKHKHEASERALRESEEKFRLISEQSMIAISVIQDGAFRYCNETFLNLVEYPLEEIREMKSLENIARLIHPDDREFVIEQISRKMQGDKDVVTNYPMRLLTSSNKTRWVEIYSKTVFFQGRPADLVTMTDISTRKQAEEERASLQAQVFHAQKLESLGVFTGGIAHDFNNLLSSILGSAELALRELPADDPTRTHMEEIHLAAEHGTELCQQMLAYAGKAAPQRGPIDLIELIREMDRLFRISISREIELQVQAPPSLPAIEGDASQIRQIVLNLIINASEASEGRKGTIVIRMGEEFCEERELSTPWLNQDLPAGDYVYLEVEDTGKGMDQSTMLRVFDPFFSTKFAGRGLGLASTLGIIKEHRGSIRVESALGKGTKFHVSFPAAKAEVASKPPEITHEWEGSGLVLLIEDEESVRAVTRRLLESLGLQVETASDGVEGLQKFSERPEAFRLVIADMIMPQLGGEEVLEEIRARRSDLPVLLTSGFSEAEAVRTPARDPLTEFLPKPFGLNELRKYLDRLLDLSKS